MDGLPQQRNQKDGVTAAFWFETRRERGQFDEIGREIIWYQELKCNSILVPVARRFLYSVFSSHSQIPLSLLQLFSPQ